MKKKGFIAISSLLIISFVVLAISVSATTLAIGELQSAFSLTQGEDVLGFVEGCAEDALWKSRADNNYNGGTITRPEGTCSISISKNGVTWTMDVTTTATIFKRTVRVIFDRNPTGITLISWKEI